MSTIHSCMVEIPPVYDSKIGDGGSYCSTHIIQRFKHNSDDEPAKMQVKSNEATDLALWASDPGLCGHGVHGCIWHTPKFQCLSIV